MRGRWMLAGLLLVHGWSIRRVGRMNVSWPTARKWARRYQAEGQAGLPEAPRHASPATTQALQLRNPYKGLRQ